MSLGFLTLVTGSKFYCGPPFCGAVLFPRAALAELEAGCEHLPAGFEDYFTRHEVRAVMMIPSRLLHDRFCGLAIQHTSPVKNVICFSYMPSYDSAGPASLVHLSQASKTTPHKDNRNTPEYMITSKMLVWSILKKKRFRYLQCKCKVSAPFALNAPPPEPPFAISCTGRLQVLETALLPPRVGKSRASAAMGEFPDQHGGCEEHPQE